MLVVPQAQLVLQLAPAQQEVPVEQPLGPAVRLVLLRPAEQLELGKPRVFRWPQERPEEQLLQALQRPHRLLPEQRQPLRSRPLGP